MVGLLGFTAIGIRLKFQYGQMYFLIQANINNSLSFVKNGGRKHNEETRPIEIVSSYV